MGYPVWKNGGVWDMKISHGYQRTNRGTTTSTPRETISSNFVFVQNHDFFFLIGCTTKESFTRLSHWLREICDFRSNSPKTESLEASEKCLASTDIVFRRFYSARDQQRFC